jgi:predicted nuclease of predicted toxin-antitoxin system
MLLFDQNLSPRLPRALLSAFPGSRHVRDLGFASADDGDVWNVAYGAGLAIVSKDADFHAFLENPDSSILELA